MLSALFDLLFPRLSLTGREGGWITEQERKAMRLSPLLLQRDELLRRGITHVDCIIAAGAYDSEPMLKKAILTMKYRRVPDLAWELGWHTAKAGHDLLALPGDLRHTRPVLCPVPLHWTRTFHRGFNQAELLAECISRAKGWKHTHLLRRTRPTGHQAWRTREERLTAVRNAFACIAPVPPVVLLVDDIVTTGSTVNECAKALKEAGTAFVGVLAIAYG